MGKKKAINSEDWFVLRLDMEPTTLEARSSNNVEIIRHTVWAYFSQRKLAYCRLLRRRGANNENAYRETTMESLIDDYQPVDGINIAHCGRTAVSLLDGHTKTRMEERWTMEEEKEGCGSVALNSGHPSMRIQAAAIKPSPSKVATVNIEHLDPMKEEDGSRRAYDIAFLFCKF